jgi:hypothetical protein
MNVSQLASRALSLGPIDAQLADGINGYSVMRLLAISYQTEISVERAMEFVVLCEGVLYAIGRAKFS